MNTIKAADKAIANMLAARADFREAAHYVPGASYRARKTAKREAKRAARRIPVMLDVDDDQIVPGDERQAAYSGALEIHVSTQYLENYGTETAPYWKFKGGSTYVLTGFAVPLNDQIGDVARMAVSLTRQQIEYSNDYSREYVIDWAIVPAGTVTEDDEIGYPSKRIALVVD